jgi:tetratricopeptide (TPR) repeat protein
MSMRVFWKAALGVAFAVGLLCAQEGGPKPLTVKSKGEADAVMAFQTALQSQNPDTIIKAADDLLTKYADSDFKTFALYYSAEAYNMKNDYDKTVIFAERTLQSDPKHYQAMLLLAGAMAQRTREHDLDKEEKLGTVEKYVKQADELVKTAPKPNPNLTDEQWEMLKKNFTSQGLEALGLAALARNQYDKAADQFKQAMELDATPNPGTMLRLAIAYEKSRKYDDALAALDKVMAMPNLHPQIKQVAQAERVRVIQAKGGSDAKAPSPGVPPAQGGTKQP